MLPSNISPESLPDKFNDFFADKIEEIRSSFGPDRLIPTNPVEFSGTVFAVFVLVTEDFVKTVVQEMSKKFCDLDPYPPLSFMIVWMNFSHNDCIINKSLSSGTVPQCFKDALVKPMLKKGSVLTPTA